MILPPAVWKISPMVVIKFEFNLNATMMDSLVLIIVSQRTDSEQAKLQ
jgi:hypothetical protein